ncbi:hypothetical protein [Nonomuraea harbinensis]|uniref:Uncharacterized protein n=1 Tax=Nonomuraea harbinensis TaxID=1286938 RepID=A0ABW1CB07_9ACTN|nr:hypothetical protein [Nonomuraea harbinensis]
MDAVHRDHAEVEDRVRTNKAMGLRNLPSKTWNVNVGWILACNIAASSAPTSSASPSAVTSSASAPWADMSAERLVPHLTRSLRGRLLEHRPPDSPSADIGGATVTPG